VPGDRREPFGSTANEAADRDIVVAFVGKPHELTIAGVRCLNLCGLSFDQYYQAEQKDGSSTWRARPIRNPSGICETWIIPARSAGAAVRALRR